MLSEGEPRCNGCILDNLFLQESEINVGSTPQTLRSYRSFCSLVEIKNIEFFKTLAKYLKQEKSDSSKFS